MLNKWIKKLNGHAMESGALAQALTELAIDRQATEAEIARLQQERHQALLDDADDKTLDAIERKIDRATVKLEKIGLAEPALREQLAAASSAERARRWQHHLVDHRTAAAEFLVAARAAHVAHARLVDVVQRARAEGFERNVGVGMPPAPNVQGAPICNLELLDAFEKLLSPAPRAPGRPPRGGVRHYGGEPNSAHYDPTRPPGAPAPTGRPVFLDTWTGAEIRPGVRIGERTERAPRLPDDGEPLSADQVRVVVLRDGFQHSDGVCPAGRRIRLRRDVALAAAQAGSVEIVETPPGGAP